MLEMTASTFTVNLFCIFSFLCPQLLSIVPVLQDGIFSRSIESDWNQLMFTIGTSRMGLDDDPQAFVHLA